MAIRRAYAMQGDRKKRLTAGVDDYLIKPVRTPLLEATLAIPYGRDF